MQLDIPWRRMFWKETPALAKIFPFIIGFYLVTKKERSGASELGQHMKALDVRPEDLRSIPKTHMVGEGDCLLQVVLCLPYMLMLIVCTHAHAHAHTHTQ